MHQRKKDGKQYDDGKVKMTQLAVKAIIKALMPRADPTKKVSEYTARYKCVDWLKGFGDWETEMEKMSGDFEKKKKADYKPLNFWKPST